MTDTDWYEAAIERMATVLRSECQAVFGAMWDNDVSRRFARAAFAEALKITQEPTDAMVNVPLRPTLTNCDEHHYARTWAAMHAAIPRGPKAEPER